SPSVTVWPTMQKGPISTPAPSVAPSSTIAVGWIAMSGVGADHRAELALGDQRLADKGLALELPDRAAMLELLDGEAQQIAGHDGAAELGLLDRHEGDLGDLVERHGMHDQRARGLGQRLDDQDARHHREFREVASEVRLVVAHRLVAGAALVRDDVGQPLDEQ